VISPRAKESYEFTSRYLKFAGKLKNDSCNLKLMHVLVCLESGLDCDFVIKGETTEEFLKNGADHAIQKHGMHAEDIYLNDIPANLLCHSFKEEL